MAYQINRYDNSLLTTVQDGTINTVTDLKFVGRNFAGYGEIQNENFLFLLENFSGLNPPPKALTGQLWYDSGLQKLKFYDGNQWKTTGGSEVQSTQPTGLAVGDFWWDSANDQLYIFNGTNFVLIGPQGAGTGVTQLVSRQVLDTANNPRNIIQAVVNDQVVFIVSHDVPFTLGASNPINGFIDKVINPGITMATRGPAPGGADFGVDFRYWGTAQNAAQLGGKDAEDFLVAPDFGQNLNFTYPITVQNDSGITLGEDFGFKIFVDGLSNGIIQNDKGLESEIRFITTDGAENTIHSVTIDRTGVIPPANNTYQLGNTTNRWSVVHAESFNGTAERAIQLRVGTNFRSASTGPVANTIAARNANGDLSAVRFIGDGSQLTNIPAAGTDLAFAGSGNSRTITSSTGASANISIATTTNAGLMSTGDKAKLNGIQTGAQMNVGTDLGLIGSGNSRTITSSTGNNVAIPAATTTNAGFMSTGDKTKLENLPDPSNVVTTSRTLIEGSGIIISGNGDLSADRTISAVQLTQQQVENSNSTVFGTVSGQRLAQAISSTPINASLEDVSGGTPGDNILFGSGPEIVYTAGPVSGPLTPTTDPVVVGFPFRAISSCEIRVSFDYRRISSDEPVTVKVLKNRVEVLVETKTSTQFSTHTVDVVVAPGDLIEVTAEGTDNSITTPGNEVEIISNCEVKNIFYKTASPRLLGGI